MSLARRLSCRTVLALVFAPLGFVSTAPVDAHPEAFAVLVELTRQIELTPDDPELLVSRGRWLERVGALEQALADYDRALELAGSGDEYHPSQLDLSRRLTTAPSDLDLIRGRLLTRLGRSVEARQALERFVAFNPEHGVGLLSLGRHHAAAGRYAEASALTARLMAQSTVPTVALTIEHSNYLEKSDQREAALAAINDVLARLKTSTALERAALRLELELGLDARAKSRLERLVATAPRPEIWRHPVIQQSKGAVN